jgi:hypothetical protein
MLQNGDAETKSDGGRLKPGIALPGAEGEIVSGSAFKRNLLYRYAQQKVSRFSSFQKI